jgi:CcmD family protein
VSAWAQEAQREFVPAESVARHELAPGPLVYGAYAFVWAAVLVYVFLLWRRLGRVERELGDVNRKLARK